MTELEKLIDDLGQIAFRLETNFWTYRRSFGCFQHPESAVSARQALESDLERLKAVKHGLAQYAQHPPLTVGGDEDRQMLLLLALAHLSVERPGWDDALNRIACRMDNVDDGKAKTYEQFKDLRQAALRFDCAVSGKSVGA